MDIDSGSHCNRNESVKSAQRSVNDVQRGTIDHSQLSDHYLRLSIVH